MSYDEDSELNDIKKQIDQKLWRRGLLGAHAIAWLVGCAFIGIFYKGAVEFVAPAWMGLVLLHGLLVLLWEKRERDIEAEVERRMMERGNQKLKRDRLYRLSDDGELMEVEDEDGITSEAQHSLRN